MKLKIPAERWNNDQLMYISDDEQNWTYELSDEDAKQILTQYEAGFSKEDLTEEDKVMDAVEIIQNTLRGNSYYHVQSVIKILATLHGVDR